VEAAGRPELLKHEQVHEVRKVGGRVSDAVQERYTVQQRIRRPDRRCSLAQASSAYSVSYSVTCQSKTGHSVSNIGGIASVYSHHPVASWLENRGVDKDGKRRKPRRRGVPAADIFTRGGERRYPSQPLGAIVAYSFWLSCRARRD
jgi:hypothetical protein